MLPEKITQLKQAIERAYQNYLKTRSDVSYRMWVRLKEELKKAQQK